ncbi:hypothetical protein [Tessaracoccus massiliensis]|uniref:hypothetical protein n=1 Tax=Tessaracoccus massiliensis TaxID=1522311 RepID=UPI0015D63E70|nr:hypothetical protein [Tessaracoccus massiliensis]
MPVMIVAPMPGPWFWGFFAGAFEAAGLRVFAVDELARLRVDFVVEVRCLAPPDEDARVLVVLREGEDPRVAMLATLADDAPRTVIPHPRAAVSGPLDR